MYVKVDYSEIGVSRGVAVPLTLVYEGVLLRLVSHDDGEQVAVYDDGAPAPEVELEEPEEPERETELEEFAEKFVDAVLEVLPPEEPEEE